MLVGYGRGLRFCSRATQPKRRAKIQPVVIAWPRALMSGATCSRPWGSCGHGYLAGEWASAFSAHISILLILLWKSLTCGLVCALFRHLFHAFYDFQAGLSIGFLSEILMKSSSRKPHYQRHKTTRQKKHVTLCLGSVLLTYFIGEGNL